MKYLLTYKGLSLELEPTFLETLLLWRFYLNGNLLVSKKEDSVLFTPVWYDDEFREVERGFLSAESMLNAMFCESMDLDYYFGQVQPDYMSIDHLIEAAKEV